MCRFSSKQKTVGSDEKQLLKLALTKGKGIAIAVKMKEPPLRQLFLKIYFN